MEATSRRWRGASKIRFHTGGLSLRDAIRAFFEGQGSPKPPPPPPLEVSFRTNGGQTFSAGDLGGAVTEASAVGELRALVAKHYDSEPKRIRLVSRGNILRVVASPAPEQGWSRNTAT